MESRPYSGIDSEPATDVYDALVRGIGGAAFELPTHEVNEATRDRLRTISKPVEIFEGIPTETNFDHLFYPDYEPSTDPGSLNRQRPLGRNHISDYNCEVAKRILTEAKTKSWELGEIITDYLAEHNQLKNVDTVQVIREDQNLRTLISEYLFTKLQVMITDMPERVRKNTNKTPGYPGYEAFGPLTSEEYVILLALSMLDGTFNYDSEDAVNRTYSGPTYEVKHGQHRTAAELLLGITPRNNN